MIAIVKDGQCLTDVALMVCGATEGVWPLAVRNDLSVTEALSVGDIVLFENADVIDSRVVAKFAVEGISPATEVSASLLQKLLHGVEAGDDTVPDIPFDEPGNDNPITRAKIFSSEFDVTFA